VVREARRRAGLTQADLARRAGTTQSAVARTERGRTAPSLEQLTRLVRAAGFDLDIRLTPADDHDWSMAKRNLGLDVDTRVRNLERAVRFSRAGRQALAARRGR
jgi:transcriptional regulator with XRE-family HTH domain